MRTKRTSFQLCAARKRLLSIIHWAAAAATAASPLSSSYPAFLPSFILLRNDVQPLLTPQATPARLCVPVRADKRASQPYYPQPRALVALTEYYYPTPVCEHSMQYHLLISQEMKLILPATRNRRRNDQIIGWSHLHGMICCHLLHESQRVCSTKYYSSTALFRPFSLPVL